MKSIYILLILLAAVSCKNRNSDADSDGAEAVSNISESAISGAGQQATSSEGATSPFVAMEAMTVHDLGLLDPQDVNISSACAFSSARTTCSSNVSTIDWAGCTVHSATLTGGWAETWSPGFCSNGALPGALTNGTSVTRTSTGQVLTLPSGATLTENTTAHSTYNSTSIPGTGIDVSMAGGTRTVVIHGLRRILKGPFGRSWFDHSITSTGITITGTRAAGTRTVSGTSTMYHNFAQYTAAHTFNTVTWGTPSCCYPTSGSVSSVLTGTRAGSVSLAFTSTCGQATFTDTDSSVSTVTLSQCN